MSVTRFWTNHTAIAMSLLTVGSYFLGYFLFGADPVRIVFGSLLVGSLATVSIILTKPMWTAIRRGVKTGGDNILVSQWGVFSLLLFYFAWVQFMTWYRIHNGEDAVSNLRALPVGGLFTTLFFIVTAFTILAPINTSEEIERPSMKRWIAAVCLGTAIAAVLGTLSFLRIINYFSAV